MGELIQFIPRPNRKRQSELAVQAMAEMFWFPWFLAAATWTDTAPSEYVAPEKDPA